MDNALPVLQDPTTGIVLDIDTKFITRSYNGRTGCMCGCCGTYSEGMTLATKRRINSIINSGLGTLQTWERLGGGIEGCIYYDECEHGRRYEDSRNTVVYFEVPLAA